MTITSTADCLDGERKQNNRKERIVEQTKSFNNQMKICVQTKLINMIPSH
jgi:hypothetical protein